MMTRLLSRVVAGAALLALTTSAYASFEQLPTGARQAGLGNAFTAIADDVYATYYNPSGLMQLARPEFTAYYARLYAGLTDGSSISRSYVAYGHPLRRHRTIGFSYLSLSLADLYTESTIAVSYAFAIRDRWNLGTSVKFLKKSFGTDTYTQSAINSDTGASLGGADPLFAQNGNSKSAASFDVGTQYRLSKIYALGFSILNVNSPNMALSSSDSDKVNAIYKFGIARRTQASSLDAEVTRQQFTSDDYRFNMGAERWFKSGIGARGGLGFGSRQYEITSVGFSYRWSNVELDYGLVYPITGIKGTLGTNQFTLTFWFGRKD